MKFSINRLDFCEAVTNISHAVAVRSSLPVLEGILLEAENNNLHLSAYNFSLGMQKDVQVQKIDREGKIVINARLLLEMIRRLNGETVFIEVDERNVCKIMSLNAEYEVLGLNADEFPSIPEVDRPSDVTIPGEVLKESVKQTIFAASQNENAIRPILMGLYFELDENIFKLTAIDGHKMAHRKENVKGNEVIDFIVPAKAIGEAVKLITEENKNVVLKVGSKYISLDINGYSIITRLLDGEFFEYNQIIPGEVSAKIRVNTKEIINIIERMSLLIQDAVKVSVRIALSQGQLTFKSETPLGKATETYIHGEDSPEFEIGFNSQYLIETLKATESDEVYISFNNARKPILITPVEGDSFMYIVMPMQI